MTGRRLYAVTPIRDAVFQPTGWLVPAVRSFSWVSWLMARFSTESVAKIDDCRFVDVSHRKWVRLTGKLISQIKRPGDFGLVSKLSKSSKF